MATGMAIRITDAVITRTTAAITDRRFTSARHTIGITATEFTIHGVITGITGTGAKQS